MFKIRNNIEEFSPDIYPYTFWVSADNDMKLINEKFTSYYHDTDQGPLQEPSSTDVLCVYQVLEKKTNKQNRGSFSCCQKKDNLWRYCT